MYRLRLLLCLGSLFLSPVTLAAQNCGGANCCGKMGGIQYCDSSAGRYVCNNGRYSSCYCKRSAVMDMQAFAGCCMWQGGVFKFDEKDGLLICNNGGVSEVCSIGHVTKKVAAW
ncbi:MAG: neurogenic locus notch [Gammaproteobacteria bacterium]|nr:neurogenic locus notch [Gammaproteobacteria bacterium]